MRILIEDNGTTTELQQNLKKERLYLKKSFRSDEPVGVWQRLTKDGIEYRDYDFEVQYANSLCDRISGKDPIALLLFDIQSINYEKPTVVIKGDEKKFRTAFRRYFNPPKSFKTQTLKGGLMIEVDVLFKVTKQGEIKDIRIAKEQSPWVDKEIVRTLKQMKFTTPPKLNGKPIDICARFPVRIQLQSNAM